MFQDVLEIAPEAEHKSTVIFLGGCGDIGENWVTKLKKTITNKHTKLVLPTPKEMHVTIFEKTVHSWFDSLSYDKKHGPEDLQGIRRAHSAVLQLIEKESLHVDRNKIFIGGFSMGGALAVYTGLNGRNLGGLFMISGYIPDRRNINYSINFPVLVMHGESDFIIPMEFAQFACEILDSNDVEHDFKTFPETGHTVSDEMLAELQKFFRRYL